MFPMIVSNCYIHSTVLVYLWWPIGCDIGIRHDITSRPLVYMFTLGKSMMYIMSFMKMIRSGRTALIFEAVVKFKPEYCVE